MIGRDKLSHGVYDAGMQANAASWQEALEAELGRVRKVTDTLGYTLEDDQPHIKGERYLLGGRTKLVLNARDSSGARAVIKASTSSAGVEEIRREKQMRDALLTLSFASDSLKIPREIHCGEHSGVTMLVTEYIEQKDVLASRPLEERFFMSLRAFEAQESFHATTYEHLQEVKRSQIPIFDADVYIRSVDVFAEDAKDVPQTRELMRGVAKALIDGRTLLERYGGYLAHFDFVPHNLRVDGRTLWILDFAELRFGNKYESWARFINYMLVHDTELAEALLTYVQTNREAEMSALHLMRIYKAALLVAFYSCTLPKTGGNSRALTELRIDLWTDITKKLLANAPFPEAETEAYIAKRDLLRTDEEKERQRGFNIR